MWPAEAMASSTDGSVAWGGSSGQDAWRLAPGASPHRGTAQAPTHRVGKQSDGHCHRRTEEGKTEGVTLTRSRGKVVLGSCHQEWGG
jgi:hypothetical protein